MILSRLIIFFISSPGPRNCIFQFTDISASFVTLCTLHSGEFADECRYQVSLSCEGLNPSLICHGSHDLLFSTGCQKHAVVFSSHSSTNWWWWYASSQRRPSSLPSCSNISHLSAKLSWFQPLCRWNFLSGFFLSWSGSAQLSAALLSVPAGPLQ